LHLVHLVRLAVKAPDALPALPGRKASKFLQDYRLPDGDSHRLQDGMKGLAHLPLSQCAAPGSDRYGLSFVHKSWSFHAGIESEAVV
jgi:hypothetical protein